MVTPDATRVRKAMGRPVFVVPLIVFAVMLMGTGAKNVRYPFFPC